MGVKPGVGAPKFRNNGATMGYGGNGGKPFVSIGFEGESIPAFRCIAGCVCGARAAWPDDRPLPRCPCGEAWRWLCPVAEVNAQSGESKDSRVDRAQITAQNNIFGARPKELKGVVDYGGEGGSARFFNSFQYLPKCSPSERHAGCENLFWRADKSNPFGFARITKEEWEALDPMSPCPRNDGKSTAPSTAHHGGTKDGQRARGNVHPTVKSYRLMHWLHALTGARRIVDICAGSGPGMLTAAIDGIDWVGAEVCPEAVEIARARHAFWSALSPAMLREFMAENVVPQSEASPAGQLGLFGA